MRILVTNDDGIDAFGIRSLEAALRRRHEVTVCAPDREQSAASHSLTLRRPLRLYERGPGRFACDGTPTDCVLVAVQELFEERPDMIVSGINHGQNMGQDVSYSGTVAAAKEGSILGVRSLASSLVSGRENHAQREKGFEAAAEFLAGFVDEVERFGLEGQTFLNINFPPLPASDLSYTSFGFTRLGTRVFKDVVVKKEDPRGETYYWIAGEPSWTEVAGSDYEAVRDGFVSVTPLKLRYDDSETLERLEPGRRRTLT